jgi:hypothetical protein
MATLHHFTTDLNVLKIQSHISCVEEAHLTLPSSDGHCQQFGLYGIKWQDD